MSADMLDVLHPELRKQVICRVALASVLKLIRVALGLSQQDLANQMGVGRMTISSYETLVALPTSGNFQRWLDVTTTRIRELSGATGSLGEVGED